MTAISIREDVIKVIMGLRLEVLKDEVCWRHVHRLASCCWMGKAVDAAQSRGSGRGWVQWMVSACRALGRRILATVGTK